MRDGGWIYVHVMTAKTAKVTESANAVACCGMRVSGCVCVATTNAKEQLKRFAFVFIFFFFAFFSSLAIFPFFAMQFFPLFFLSLTFFLGAPLAAYAKCTALGCRCIDPHKCAHNNLVACAMCVCRCVCVFATQMCIKIQATT